MSSETVSIPLRELITIKMTILCGAEIIVHRLKSLNWGHWTAHAGPARLWTRWYPACWSQGWLAAQFQLSTGGDSIDVTDSMHPSYKRNSLRTWQGYGTWACGVDLIIPDSSAISTKENPNCTCIELNFSPSMYMHTLLCWGPGQSITPKILAKTFPRNGPIK